ncbi:MAG: GntR family transcriptional regulator [Clostridiales bacterium]|nr:GntR family transcriptional regulator [Clostridiales bacterium]
MLKYNQLVQALKEELEQAPAGAKLATRLELRQKYGCTRTTVDRAIAELTREGYVYSLRGSGTYAADRETVLEGAGVSWALITPDVMNSIYTAILRGMCDIARQHNISVQIFNTDHDVRRQYDIIRSLAAARIGGVVLVPAIDKEGQEAACRLLVDNQVPFVFCNRKVEGVHDVPLVCSNGYYGGYLATKHLLEQGYVRPAFLGMKAYSVSLERYYGYAAAIMEAGMDLDRRCVALETDFQAEWPGYSETTVFLRLDNPPDSIFCAGESFKKPLLNGVYKAIEHMGLNIPGDIGVISHDNSVVCLQQSPNTTAVSYPAYASGLKAAEILCSLMNKVQLPAGGLYIQHPELVKRESCLGPAAQRGTEGQER